MTFLLSLLLWFQSTITPSSIGSTILGAVVDSASHSPVSGAKIALVGTVFSTTSADNGYYALKKVPAGKYSLTVSKSGFRTIHLTGITVPKESIVHLDISLVNSLPQSPSPRPGYDDLPLLIKERKK